MQPTHGSAPDSELPAETIAEMARRGADLRALFAKRGIALMPDGAGGTFSDFRNASPVHALRVGIVPSERGDAFVFEARHPATQAVLLRAQLSPLGAHESWGWFWTVDPGQLASYGGPRPDIIPSHRRSRPLEDQQMMGRTIPETLKRFATLPAAPDAG